jgi:predicted SnoaL-like aldol condensation-catalyzing enzyme
MEFDNKLKPIQDILEKEYRSGSKVQNKKWREARKQLTEAYRKQNPNWDVGKRSFKEKGNT